MNDQKAQIVEKLKSASNILVTVSNNPSIDQLSACIALSLIVNKMKKQGTAVFSGRVPTTLDFLNPAQNLQQNPDNLRDFIISLDKSKADKLRYKVEDDIVKIFITPYHTSLSQKDFTFEPGDFNIDVIVALGVHHQQDLDGAITAHGRIFHDAVVLSINTTPDGDLGTINWQELEASSLSELVATLAQDLGSDLLDEQISTALLAGIVAETNHFSNGKTHPQTMSVSSALLAAGANQQLVSKELQDQPGGSSSVATLTESETEVQDILKEAEPSDAKQSEASKSKEPQEKPIAQAPEQPAQVENVASPDAPTPNVAEATFVNLSEVKNTNPPSEPKANSETPGLQTMTEPLGTPFDALAPAPGATPLPSPQMPTVTANASQPLDPVADSAVSKSVNTPGTPTSVPDHEQTLAELEESLLKQQETPGDVGDARKAVEDALYAEGAENPVETPAAFNAQIVDLDLGHDPVSPPEPNAPIFQAPPEVVGRQMPYAQPQLGLPTTPAGAQQIAPNQPPYSSPLSTTEYEAPAPSSMSNEPAPLGMSPADQPFTMPLPPSAPPAPTAFGPPPFVSNPQDNPAVPAPPPVPPPMMPPNFGPPPA